MRWTAKQRMRWFWVMMVFGAIFLTFMVIADAGTAAILTLAIPYLTIAIALLGVGRRSSDDV